MSKPVFNKIPRSEDPRYIRNPMSGRYLLRGGVTHRAAISAGYYKKAHHGENVATGTNAELVLMKRMLDNEGHPDYKLVIRGNKLIKRRIIMKKQDLIDHTLHHSINSAVNNRNLMKSNLSNVQLTELLSKVCDAGIMGVDIDLEYEFNQLCSIAEERKTPTPQNTPELKPQITPELPPPILKKMGSKVQFNKFVVGPAPIFSETDAYSDAYTDAYSDSD